MQLFAADNFSRQHFQMLFFLGALRVKDISNIRESALNSYAKGSKYFKNVSYEEKTLLGE